jgi:DNA invertase Pin-like site-specific DNA recombinase
MTDALSHLRAGDTLMIWKLDWLGRSVRQFVEFTAELEKRGIQFASLTDVARQRRHIKA